jgi:hypothetical protein
MINQGDYAAISAEKTEKSYPIDVNLIGFGDKASIAYKYTWRCGLNIYFLICFCTKTNPE